MNERPGRPSKFTPEIAAEICARLSEGEPLAQICRDDHMPGDGTVRDWQKLDDEFAGVVAQAREAGFDRIAADCLAIADDGSRDYKPGPDGRDVPDTDHIQRSKLRVDTRLKLLAKWDPKRYGERQEIRHADADGKSFAIMVVPKAASDDEWQSENS